MRKVPKLRFKEFTDEWEEKKLGEIGVINPKSKTLPENFIYIDLESVIGGQLKEKKIIEKKEAPSRAKRVVEKNDILYQTVRPYQQNNLYFSFNDELDYVASTGYAQIRIFYNNSGYVYYLIHTKKFLDKVLERCTGTSYPAINSEDLARISIKISKNISEQEKIANFLSSVDKKISLTEEKLELFKEYRKGVMQKIFSQELRFKDNEGNDYPEWEEKRLGEIGEIITGKTPSTKEEKYWNGELQFVTPSDIKGSKYQFITERKVSEKMKIKFLPKGTIMFTCIASIGKMSISTDLCITNQQINSIIVNEQISNEYVYYYLLNIVPKIQSSKSTTTMPIINKTEFSKFEIQLPILEEQQKIADFLSSIDTKIEKIEKELENLKEFKKGLLQQMFI